MTRMRQDIDSIVAPVRRFPRESTSFALVCSCANPVKAQPDHHVAFRLVVITTEVTRIRRRMPRR